MLAEIRNDFASAIAKMLYCWTNANVQMGCITLESCFDDGSRLVPKVFRPVFRYCLSASVAPFRLRWA